MFAFLSIRINPLRHGLWLAALTFAALLPAGASAQNLHLNMVAVGINQYQYPGMNLNFAVADAQDLTRSFNANRLFGRKDINILLNQQATLQNLHAALALLQQRATANSYTVLFLSGHGSRNGQGHFLYPSYQYDPRRAEATSLTCEAIRARLGNLPGRVLVIIDACHSGSMGNHTHWIAPGRASQMITISSSLAQEVSLEKSDLRNGAFTQALLEALSGTADANRDRVLSLTEVNNYLRARVLQLTGGKQHTIIHVPSQAFGNLAIATLANANSGVQVWQGRENLQGYGAVSFTFASDGRVLMTDVRGRKMGTWTNQNGVLTLRFDGGRIIYSGRISGTTFSGTAQNARTRWNFAVARN